MIKSYEAIAVSNTIQPGSSGSSVYNRRERIGAVIFAGAGDFGYGFAVPHEYVYNFIHMEVKYLRPRFPNSVLTVSSNDDKNKHKDLVRKIEVACEGLKDNKVCKLFMAASKNNDLVE